MSPGPAPLPAEASAPAPARRPAGGKRALAFALAALFACWNTLSAPLAVIVGLGAALLGWRARRRGVRPALAWSAVAAGLLAAVAAGAVLAYTGKEVLTDLPGQPVVKARTNDEMGTVLDEAGARTRAERERARKQLERAAPR